MSELRSAMGDLKRIREIGCLGEFDDFASEALPYWIRRAERMEKALDRACHQIFFHCHEIYAAKSSTEEWKEYFLEGDSDA